MFTPLQCRLISGRHIVKQITNKLIRMHISRQNNGDDDDDDREEYLEDYVESVRRNGDFLFPPFHVKSVNTTKKTIVCESFVIKSTFPDNIVLLSPVNADDVVIFCIEAILFDKAGLLKLRGRRFVKVENTFSTPYESNRIGSFICKTGLADEESYHYFSDVKGKCFPFPLKMPSVCAVDPANKDQHWILQVIRHGGLNSNA